MDIYVAKKTRPRKKEDGKAPATLAKKKKVFFEGQQKGERVVLFMRPHPITNIPWILTSFLMLIIPFFLPALPISGLLPSRFIFVGIVLWYLITTGFILENFLGWFFNVYILTQRRIVDVDFFNLIHKQVSDASLDRIQDITYKMGGVAGTLFNYGDVLVQTAGSSPNFDFDKVAKPQEVARTLQTLLHKKYGSNFGKRDI